MTVLHDLPAAPRRLRLGSGRALKGAALVMALLEAIAAHAKPQSDGLRLNARNTPVPGGDAYDTGRGLLAAGDVTGAMAAFRQALSEAPQSVDTLNAIAVCYDRLGRYDVSRSYYDAALALAPGSVQVLNNLGYSLYLQGELRGAIPFLQQAAAAGDPQATATSRRLLQLIGVKLRESEARASMAAAVAELKAPAARIELAANGEQRLVLSAAKVRPEVAATLGEAAALTVVPKVWTARDEKRLEADEAARERAETVAILAEVAELTAADAALRAANPINIASAEAATGITTAFPITPPVDVPSPVSVAPPVRRPAVIAFTPTLLAPPAPAAAAPGRSPAASTAGKTGARILAKTSKAGAKASTSPSTKAAPAAEPTPLATAAAEARATAGRLVANSFGYAADVIDIPGWIVASRRDGGPGTAVRVVGQSPDASGAIAGFDSDDPVLNAFAARMRGSANDNGAPAITPEVAVSRLEALIARLRRA
jgi:Tfp pilus assembly protein PilF